MLQISQICKLQRYKFHSGKLFLPELVPPAANSEVGALKEGGRALPLLSSVPPGESRSRLPLAASTRDLQAQGRGWRKGAGQEGP